MAGWRKTSLKGTPLLISRLSGKLTKMQMFRGTICEVSERAYLLRRLNDQPIEEVAAAEATEAILLDQILAMVRLLDPRDFELMVELIFSTSGWQRQTRTGGTQKTVDLDLLLPSTGERAFVQVKSETSADTFEAYASAFASTRCARQDVLRVAYRQYWHPAGATRDHTLGAVRGIRKRSYRQDCLLG